MSQPKKRKKSDCLNKEDVDKARTEYRTEFERQEEVWFGNNCQGDIEDC